jgi:CBS domain-containing protein
VLVRDVMTDTVTSIPVDTTIAEAVELMRELEIGFLPVIHENVCAGVLTDRDIARWVTTSGLDPAETTAGMILSRRLAANPGYPASYPGQFLSIFDESSLEEALEAMDQHQVNHLVVENDEFELVGVVSRSDLQQPLLVKAN